MARATLLLLFFAVLVLEVQANCDGKLEPECLKLSQCHFCFREDGGVGHVGCFQANVKCADGTKSSSSRAKKFLEPMSFPKDCEKDGEGSNLCQLAFQEAFAAVAGPAVVADSWAANDITKKFNPWRILSIDRPAGEHVALGNLAGVGVVAAKAKASFDTWLAQTKVVLDKQCTDMGLEDEGCGGYFNCFFQVKNIEDAASSKTYWPSADRESNCTHFAKIHEQPAMWYYWGLISGWLNKNEDVKTKVKASSIVLQFDMSTFTPVAQQARAAGWHIDGGWAMHENPAFFFVGADKWPTKFLVGEVGKLLDVPCLTEGDRNDTIKKLDGFKCAKPPTDPDVNCEGSLFDRVISGPGAGTAFGGVFNEKIMDVAFGAVTPNTKTCGALPDGVSVKEAGGPFELAFMGPYQMHLAGWNTGDHPDARFFMRWGVNHEDYNKFPKYRKDFEQQRKNKQLAFLERNAELAMKMGRRHHGGEEDKAEKEEKDVANVYHVD